MQSRRFPCRLLALAALLAGTAAAEDIGSVDTEFVLVGPDPDGEECVWFEFERKNGDNKVPRMLEIFGTGHLIPPLSTHVLSFKSGPFMWHLYDHGEVTKPLGAH